MGLNEEELKFIKEVKMFPQDVGNGLIPIIDRLVAENEELRGEKNLAVKVAAEFRKLCHEQEDRLDVIGEAWEPFQQRREEVAKCFMRPLAPDTEIGVDNKYFEALDAAIRGVK